MSEKDLSYAIREIIETEETFVKKLLEFAPKIKRGLINLSTELNDGLYTKAELENIHFGPFWCQFWCPFLRMTQKIYFAQINVICFK